MAMVFPFQYVQSYFMQCHFYLCVLLLCVQKRPNTTLQCFAASLTGVRSFAVGVMLASFYCMHKFCGLWDQGTCLTMSYDRPELKQKHCGFDVEAAWNWQSRLQSWALHMDSDLEGFGDHSSSAWHFDTCCQASSISVRIWRSHMRHIESQRGLSVLVAPGLHSHQTTHEHWNHWPRRSRKLGKYMKIPWGKTVLCFKMFKLFSSN